MRKEEIDEKIKLCEEKYNRLEQDILELQEESDRNKKEYKILQEESQYKMELFSPRSSKSENTEKIHHILEKLKTIEETIDKKNEERLHCKERMTALRDMLNQCNVQDHIKADIILEDVEKERVLAGNKISESVKKQIHNENHNEYKYIELKEDQDHRMEIQSGEIIILEQERKKEREFLKQLYVKSERALAFLSGNNNPCKKEIQQIKKMIAEYVESISN